MASQVSGLYKGVDCTQIVATQPILNTVALPVAYIFPCPACQRDHSFTFQRQVFVSTASLRTRFENYTAMNNIAIAFIDF